MLGDERTRELIANRLRAAREMAGLSQSQVAKVLQLHRPSISEIEAGRRSVSSEELIKLAQLYGVTVAWITNTQSESDRDPRIELAARELARLKPKDVDSLMKFLTAIKDTEEPK